MNHLLILYINADEDPMLALSPVNNVVFSPETTIEKMPKELVTLIFAQLTHQEKSNLIQTSKRIYDGTGGYNPTPRIWELNQMLKKGFNKGYDLVNRDSINKLLITALISSIPCGLILYVSENKMCELPFYPIAFFSTAYTIYASHSSNQIIHGLINQFIGVSVFYNPIYSLALRSIKMYIFVNQPQIALVITIFGSYFCGGTTVALGQITAFIYNCSSDKVDPFLTKTCELVGITTLTKTTLGSALSVFFAMNETASWILRLQLPKVRRSLDKIGGIDSI